MKWANLDENENTWEPADSLNCAEALEEFFTTLAHYIFGVKLVEGQPNYFLKFKDCDISPEVIHFDMARLRYPVLLFDFYDSNLEWITANGVVVVETTNLRKLPLDLEDPARITCK